MMCPVAMYSLVSQNAVVGASVSAYSAKTSAPAIAAALYGGEISPAPSVEGSFWEGLVPLVASVVMASSDASLPGRPTR